MAQQNATDDATDAPGDLTTYVRDPVVLSGEAAEDADLNRWQDYGHDRLYLNAATTGTGPIPGASGAQYLDLKTGEAVMKLKDVYGDSPQYELTAKEVEEGVVRIENGMGTHVLTIDLFGPPEVSNDE